MIMLAAVCVLIGLFNKGEFNWEKKARDGIQEFKNDGEDSFT